MEISFGAPCNDVYPILDDETEEPDDPNHYIIIMSVYDPHVL